MAEEKKAKHHKFSHSHIEWHKDNSATVHHVHETDPKQDVKHAAGDLDAVHDSLENHIGAPNPGEAEAGAGPIASAAPPAMAGGAPPPGM